MLFFQGIDPRLQLLDEFLKLLDLLLQLFRRLRRRLRVGRRSHPKNSEQ